MSDSDSGTATDDEATMPEGTRIRGKTERQPHSTQIGDVMACGAEVVSEAKVWIGLDTGTSHCHLDRIYVFR